MKKWRFKKWVKSTALVLAVVCSGLLIIAYTYNKADDMARQCNVLKGHICTMYELEHMED